MTSLSLYEVPDDDLPRAMQDAQTLNILQAQSPVEAIEKGERFHPNGIVERYERVEFHV